MTRPKHWLAFLLVAALVGLAASCTSVLPKMPAQPMPSDKIDCADIVRVTMLKPIPQGGYQIEAFDALVIQTANAPGDTPTAHACKVDAAGNVLLGPHCGTVHLAGRTMDEARQVIEEKLRKVLKNPAVAVQLAPGSEPVTGYYLVEPDGAIVIRQYGHVKIAGKTIPEARRAVQACLARFVASPQVRLEAATDDHEHYYLICPRTGPGGNVAQRPLRPGETALAAVSQVDGLAELSDLQAGISRPTSRGRTRELSIDWEGIVTGADLKTNYAILPGDRVWVTAEPVPAWKSGLARLGLSNPGVRAGNTSSPALDPAF